MRTYAAITALARPAPGRLMPARGFGSFPPARGSGPAHDFGRVAVTRPLQAKAASNAQIGEPASGRVIQCVFDKPGKKGTSFTDAEIEDEVKAAELTPDGEEFIRELSKHGKKFDLADELKRARTLFGGKRGPSSTGTVVPIKSSKLRYQRQIQEQYGGTRNIAVEKLRHNEDGSVIYLGARSMGLMVPQLELNPTLGRTKRSHSEALLVGAHQAGFIGEESGPKIKLEDYTREYVSSTNEFCQETHQNCAGHLAPILTNNNTIPAFFANKYSGSVDAGSFKSGVSAHRKLKENTDFSYGSDTESEPDAELYMVNDELLQGKKIEKGQTILVQRIEKPQKPKNKAGARLKKNNLPPGANPKSKGGS
ncbi:MAG TPA: hypothetical protein VJT67_12465 [Longimicrobiaceae bacterium]|nr:hypothetical protein [Longimicrobiaceae bacterium]